MSVLLLFLLATAAGTLTTLYWIPEPDLGRGYFQMNALVVLGLLGLVVAALLLGSGDLAGSRPLVGAALGALAAAFVYYAAVWRESWRWGRWPLTLALLASAAALLIAGWAAVRTPAALPHSDLLRGLNLGTSALLLGWSLITMLLGHWYLVAPRLAFRHLVTFCWVLIGVVILRAGAVAASLVVAAGVDPLIEPHPWRLLVSAQGQGMFFWVRLAWGLAVPLALALMSLHCARHRSNQSATGILYVLVVGAFVGEITALYVAVATGIPI